MVASLLHIGEEYVWPGGFLRFLQRVAPSLTVGLATPGFAVVINGLMVAGLVVAALVGPAVPSVALVALSGAALIAVNGLGHLTAAVRTRSYGPGMVTGGLVYLPVAVAAYTAFGLTSRLTVGVVVVGVLLGWPTTWCRWPGLACIGCWLSLLNGTRPLRRAADPPPGGAICLTHGTQHARQQCRPATVARRRSGSRPEDHDRLGRRRWPR